MSTAAQIQPSGLTFSEIVAANVRALAGRRGIIPAELALRLGISRATMSRRWTGKQEWAPSDLEAVAQALGTTPWALTQPAAGDEWEPEPLEWKNAPGPTLAAESGALVRQKGFEPPTFCQGASESPVTLAPVLDLARARAARRAA